MKHIPKEEKCLIIVITILYYNNHEVTFQRDSGSSVNMLPKKYARIITTYIGPILQGNNNYVE